MLDALKKAHKLSEATPYNVPQWVFYTQKGLKEFIRENTLSNFSQQYSQLLPTFTPNKLIEILITALEKSEYHQGFLGGNVYGENAARSYFINSLTAAFVQKTGEAHNEIVADSVSAALECVFAGPDIAQKTKTLNLNLCHPVNCFDISYEKSIEIIESRLESMG